jgi:hypothetical protein
MSIHWSSISLQPPARLACALVATCGALALPCAGQKTAPVPLVRNGAPAAGIVLPAEPAAREQLAADELVEHLRLISGATLPVVAADAVPAGLVPLFLGAAADAALDAAVKAAGDNPSSFALRVSPERIDLRGLSDEGTLFAAYELLEQLGVRWYTPGEDGRVIPEAKSVALNSQQTVQAPSMELRLLQPWTEHTAGWIARQRLGGRRRSTGGHGIPPFSGGALRKKMFDQHPECFALIGGQRQMRQICAASDAAVKLTTEWIRGHHPPTREKFYVGMGPNDGGGYCECDGCRALDGDVHDPFANRTAHTGRYVDYYNRVLAALEDDYPNLHIVWYVYASHMMPPPDAVKPNPRIVGSFAPISMDRLRSMDNPMSTDRHALRYLVESWSALKPNELYYRGYYNNLACLQFPKTQLDRVRNEIPWLRSKGVNVMRVECISGSTMWDTDPLTLYVAARLMWNTATDVDALLDEFYRLFYGPAAAPMKRYFEQLEAAIRDTPWSTGSSYLYLPMFMGQSRRGELRALLDQAVALTAADAAMPVYGRRVDVLRQGYRRLDLFLDMIEARNAFDFSAAREKMTAYEQLSQSLYDVVIEGEGRRAWRKGGGSLSYLNRFFRQPIASGYQRTVEIGKPVATLPDEWLFLLDPSDVGQVGGWHRPAFAGGNWQPLKTTTLSWSDQGMHYYKGVAWYRQKASIPPQYKGRPIYLWFGGVDELASVWVNGQYLGTNREPEGGLPGVPGTFRPFDLDATKAVVFGAENWVVVRIVNKSLDELGTGGIVAPVMFWTPNDPAWKPE